MAQVHVICFERGRFECGNQFLEVGASVKELNIRMLSRICTWHYVSDIDYDDINVPAAFTELDYIRYVYFCNKQRLTKLQHSYL
jgi:hypothetical protein